MHKYIRIPKRSGHVMSSAKSSKTCNPRPTCSSKASHATIFQFIDNDRTATESLPITQLIIFGHKLTNIWYPKLLALALEFVAPLRPVNVRWRVLDPCMAREGNVVVRWSLKIWDVGLQMTRRSHVTPSTRLYSTRLAYD